ncbi:hypothetical protein TRVL_05342 [Trypanosoma vivax]|nr:hypothetical protein TRVL_05342 [Trypanosoma vivax]
MRLERQCVSLSPMASSLGPTVTLPSSKIESVPTAQDTRKNQSKLLNRCSSAIVHASNLVQRAIHLLFTPCDTPSNFMWLTGWFSSTCPDHQLSSTLDRMRVVA